MSTTSKPRPTRTSDEEGDDCPRLLVLLALPEKEQDWVMQSVEQLIVRRCAYGTSLAGFLRLPPPRPCGSPSLAPTSSLSRQFASCWTACGSRRACHDETQSLGRSP